MPTYAKKFRVMAITLNADQTRRITGMEYDPAVFTIGDPGDVDAPGAYTPNPALFTEDNGRTWAAGATNPSINADYDAAGVLWSINTTDRQLRRSTNNSLTWSGAVGVAIPGTDAIQTGGLACGSGQTIIVILQSATTCFAAVTLNQGASWTIYTVFSDTGYRACTLMFNRTFGDFCLVVRAAADFGSRIIRSDDQGQTWAVVNGPYGVGSTSGAFTDTLFVTRLGTWLASQSFQVQSGPDRINRILRSTNGTTWSVVYTSAFGDENTGDLNFFSHSKFSEAYSGAQTGRIRLARDRFSDDDGQTWSYTFTVATRERGYWQTTGIAGTMLERALDGVVDRMRYSTDGGGSWIDTPTLATSTFRIITSSRT